MKTRILVILFLVFGLVIFFAHLGVFVFIYLPAALIFAVLIFVRSRRLKKQETALECPKCGSSLPDHLDREIYCPYCGELLEEAAQKGGFFKEIEYPLSGQHKVLRRILGLTCLSWVVTFATVTLTNVGIYAVIPLVIVIFFHPFVLPCLLVGIYQLRATRGNRKISLLMLVAGIGVLIFLLSSVLKHGSLGSERDLYLFAIQWGSTLLTILNGLTCVEKISKKLSVIAIAATCLIGFTISFPVVLIVYSQIAHDLWNQWCSFFLLLSLVVTGVTAFIAVATTLLIRS